MFSGIPCDQILGFSGDLVANQQSLYKYLILIYLLYLLMRKTDHLKNYEPKCIFIYIKRIKPT